MFIHVKILANGAEKEWSLLCVYEIPYRNLKCQFWEQITHRVARTNGNWVLLGDLNQVVLNSEKFGDVGLPRVRIML